MEQKDLMITEIMSDWLMKFDKKMNKNKINVLLFAENVALRPHLKMKNVERCYFDKIKK